MYPTDPIDAVTHSDPYPYYRALARQQPFFRHERLQLWVAAGAPEVAAVLEHPACRVRPVAQPVPPALAGNAGGQLFGSLVRMNDGAAHGPLKSLLQEQLMRLDLAAATRRATRMAAGLPHVDGDDACAANRWMFALPVLTMADLLGMPLGGDDAAHLSLAVAERVAAFAAAMSPLATATEVEAGVAAARWLTQWMDTQVHAQDGLYARLCEAASAPGEPAGHVGRATLTANAIGLMVQACEATAGLVGNTLVRLGRDVAAVDGGAGDNGAVERLADHAGDLARLVADVARSDPPVQNTRRFLAADAMLCGTPLQAGDVVLVLLAAASYDPTQAAAPHPWTFGNGRHACPGAALAHVLATCTVAGLLRHGVRPARLVQAFRYRPSVNARIPLFL